MLPSFVVKRPENLILQHFIDYQNNQPRKTLAFKKQQLEKFKMGRGAFF
jgi:hypothetical protein